MPVVGFVEEGGKFGILPDLFPEAFSEMLCEGLRCLANVESFGQGKSRDTLFLEMFVRRVPPKDLSAGSSVFGSAFSSRRTKVEFQINYLK